MKKILDSKQLAAALDNLYALICSELPADRTVAVIGVRTRGETLAKRLVERLERDHGDIDIAFGVLDITFYRDDLSRRRGVPLVRATEIDFDINNTWLLLVDDVIETGRSVRAALDALHDFGRPEVIRLATLIDRGGRQVPIAADFVGHRAEVDATQRVQVRLNENDGKEGVFIIEKDNI